MHLLIDHTTAHALDTAATYRDWQEATRSVLQFVEELCVASEMWISDTESGKTLTTSMAVRDIVEHSGLKSRSESALLRTAIVNDYEFREMILPRAARALYGTLFRLGSAGDLHKQMKAVGERVTAEIRVSVQSARSVPSLMRELEWESDERLARAEELIADKEQGSAAALLLLNRPLFVWAKKLVIASPDGDDPAYRHLHLLSRWYINLELAHYASKLTDSSIQYAPAYARANVLGAGYLPNRAAKLHFMQKRLWQTYLEYGFVKYGGEAPQVASLPLPLIGAGVLLSLPRKAEIEDLLKAVGEVRASSFGLALRDLLSDRRSTLDINVVVGTLRKQLRIPKSVATSLKARLTFMTTPPFVKGELVAEKDLSRYGDVTMADVLGYIYSKPDVTVLTPFMEDVLAERTLENDLVERVGHMLHLAA